MTRKEQVWRALLREFREGRRTPWQQKDLASRLGMSLSTVHGALTLPRRAGAVRAGRGGVEILDWRKLLLIWAVHRNLEEDTLWRARVALPAAEIEGVMVPEARFTGPSGFKFHYGFAPADYDEVSVYLDPAALPELRRRLGPRLDERRGETLLTVLRPDTLLPPRVPPEQLYVDLWQMQPWWTADFIRALEERLEETSLVP